MAEARPRQCLNSVACAMRTKKIGGATNVRTAHATPLVSQHYVVPLVHDHTACHLALFHPFEGGVDLLQLDAAGDQLIEFPLLVHIEVEEPGHIYPGAGRGPALT